QRAAMQCLSRKPERDDHRETRLSPQGFSHLLQDCEIPHQPYLICEKTFEQIRLNVELQASEAPASQHGAEAPYLLEQRLWGVNRFWIAIQGEGFNALMRCHAEELCIRLPDRSVVFESGHLDEEPS